jgi:hypothetical protein
LTGCPARSGSSLAATSRRMRWLVKCIVMSVTPRRYGVWYVRSPPPWGCRPCSHDAAAKKANRERLTPALPFAVIPGVRIPATLMAYGAEAGGIVTAIPVRGRHAKPGPKLASRNLGLTVVR